MHKRIYWNYKAIFLVHLYKFHLDKQYKVKLNIKQHTMALISILAIIFVDRLAFEMSICSHKKCDKHTEDVLSNNSSSTNLHLI